MDRPSRWLGRQNTSFRYGQISSIDLYLGPLGDGFNGTGWVVITSTGEHPPLLGHDRDPAHLIKAKNVCAFDLLSAANFQHVVKLMRSNMYTPPP